MVEVVVLVLVLTVELEEENEERGSINSQSFEAKR